MPRVIDEDLIYHVFNRGIARKSIRFTEYHAGLFIELLEAISEKYNIEIYAYCIMKNHYHLLLKTNEPNIHLAMQYFTGIFAKRVNEDIHSDGALFKGRYQSLVVDSERYFLQVCRYIHMNPVEAEIVALPEQYALSSYNTYLSKDRDNTFVNTKEILHQFLNISEFEEFTKLGTDKKLKKFYKRKRLPQFIDLEN